jgi:hypothetical protein
MTTAKSRGLDITETATALLCRAMLPKSIKHLIFASL